MKLEQILIATIFCATATFANEHLNEIAGTAKKLQGDFSTMAQTLKNKNFAADDLKRDLEAVRTHVDRLKAVASEFEASKPNLHGQSEAEWLRTKELIALVGIFHDRKAEILDGSDARKNRKLLEAKAKGLMRRSAMLGESAQKLARTLGDS